MNKDIKYLVERLFDDNDELLTNDESIESELNIADNINQYKFVDLGLPSGTLWCDRNIGAKSPYDQGLLFQWGLTKGAKFGDYTHLFHSSLPLKTYGKNYNKIFQKLNLRDDPAYMNTNKCLVLPTIMDFHELTSNTEYQIVKINGIKGFLFTSKINNNSIFIPVNGLVQWDNFKGQWEYFKGDDDTFILWTNSCIDGSKAQDISYYTYSKQFITNYDDKRKSFPVRGIKKIKQNKR